MPSDYTPITRYDFKGDAKRVFEIMKAGGIAVCPATVGYGIVTSDSKQLERIFLSKQRAATKRHAMAGSYEAHRSIHVVNQLSREIIDHLVFDLDVPFAIIAEYKKDHPIFKKIDSTTMEAVAVNGTVAMLINAGPFQDELLKLTLPEDIPLLGSSANISQTGTKYTVEEIQKDLMDLADTVVDYGLLKYNNYMRSSTMIDFSGPKPEVVRIGDCYELIKDTLWRNFQIEIPSDPGLEKNKFGHLKHQKPLASLEKLIQTGQVMVQ